MRPYDLVRPLFFRLSPETAHHVVESGLSFVQGTPAERVISKGLIVDDERLGVDVFGRRFPNPIGVAAGFDKNATVPRSLAALGFGHVEVGGVTAEAQPGNPKPRLFRLPEDEAIVNRMGLNNAGADVIGRRLESVDVPVPVGVNLAKTERVSTENAPADYRRAYEAVADGGDFFVVNVSCPNAENFRELQNRDAMEAILGELIDAGAGPLLVKLSPDLPDPAVEDALEIVEDLALDGVVATNTTTSRPKALENPNRTEEGGLSGKPIEEQSTEMVQFVAERTDVPVVGVGGVFTAEDAYRKIRAGASLVQLYTSLIYRGPTVARDVNRGLIELLERDGVETIEDAVGADL